ncbi:MAG: metallophosphoesterase [Candidatus Bathyarchaeia archaeon]
MKLLIVSDFHQNLHAVERARRKATLEGVDVIVVCGDLTHFGTISTAEEILKRFVGLEVVTLFVPGNCDPKDLSKHSVIGGAYCLHGRYKTVDDLSFVGVGGSTPVPFPTEFEIGEDELTALLEEAYGEFNGDGRLVLVSHVPPKHTRLDLIHFGVYVGSVALREFIERRRPLLVVCGHIHERRGVDKINDTLIVNPGPAMWGLCALVEIGEEVRASLSLLE